MLAKSSADSQVSISLKAVRVPWVQPSHKGFKCLYPSTRRVYISRDVTFDENVFPFSQLHPNVGARLHQEISLLPSDLLPSRSDQGRELIDDHMFDLPNHSNACTEDDAENSVIDRGGDATIFPGARSHVDAPVSGGARSQADTGAGVGASDESRRAPSGDQSAPPTSQEPTSALRHLGGRERDTSSAIAPDPDTVTWLLDPVIFSVTHWLRTWAILQKAYTTGLGYCGISTRAGFILDSFVRLCASPICRGREFFKNFVSTRCKDLEIIKTSLIEKKL